MKYTLHELPPAIRQQVEDFIEFLLTKHQTIPDQPSVEATVPQMSAKEVAARWRGVLKGVDPDAAKDDYLKEKYR